MSTICLRVHDGGIHTIIIPQGAGPLQCRAAIDHILPFKADLMRYAREQWNRLQNQEDISTEIKVKNEDAVVVETILDFDFDFDLDPHDEIWDGDPDEEDDLFGGDRSFFG
jgi:hypothetical protein